VKLLQGLFLVVLTAVLSVASLLTASAFRWAQELPDLASLDLLEFTATSQVFARDGSTLIGEIVPVMGEDRASIDRIPVSLEEVSPAALMAIVASEDDRFFAHFGFDIPGLLMATYLELLGPGGRGGSTITVQVVKNHFFRDIADERTLERKMKELMLAIELERRLTKAEILQRYINLVFWGGNLYGIRAAARAYFDKDPIELNLAEGLYLARLIPSPNRNHNDFVATRRSMRVVLDNMVSRDMISREMAERAWRYPLQPRGWSVQYDAEGNIVGEPVRTAETLNLSPSVRSELAPHALWTVRNSLIAQFGESRVFGAGGLRVYTTIDVQAQEAANLASLEGLVPDGAQLAIVGLNPQTGEILAMVGSKLRPGELPGEFNRAMSARRQPGSSFKPIVYATAIEQGGYTQARVIADESTAFPVRGQPPYTPENHDRTFQGRQTLRQHLNVSRNIPAVKLAEAVTPEAVVARARELGYQGLQPFLSVALGAFEVTPLQHASAIGAFANGGVHVEPHLITRVEDADGNVLWEAVPRETRVWTEQTAYTMLDMLYGGVNDPGAFGGRARIDGRWIGGKTGTTNDSRDIWFVGLTPGLAAAVWIGYDDNRPIPSRIPGLEGERATVNSARHPVWIWRNFVERTLRGTPAGRRFEPPPGITFNSVNLISGALDPGGVRMAFVGGSEVGSSPLSFDPINITVAIDRRTGVRATATTPREFIEWSQISPSEIGRFAATP